MILYQVKVLIFLILTFGFGFLSKLEGLKCFQCFSFDNPNCTFNQKLSEEYLVECKSDENSCTLIISQSMIIEDSRVSRACQKECIPMNKFDNQTINLTWCCSSDRCNEFVEIENANFDSFNSSNNTGENSTDYELLDLNSTFSENRTFQTSISDYLNKTKFQYSTESFESITQQNIDESTFEDYSTSTIYMTKRALSLRCMSCPTDINGECFSEKKIREKSNFTVCPDSHTFCSIVTVFISETNKTLIVRGCQLNCTSDSYVSNNLTFNTYCCQSNLCNRFPNERINVQTMEIYFPTASPIPTMALSTKHNPKQSCLKVTSLKSSPSPSFKILNTEEEL
ncbi:hypothetical protein BpHYR1_042823 [Brachionus plicatilis]|uniref:UPAR/Ly6 domain-containing protein n=1 Tax=Brachionus plicatilis TaxID=10195 RepID=A0A3M7QQP0_BRAPC|nr:hypothetical protein BpHYR1_042823 [Brachionus plicatilis]